MPKIWNRRTDRGIIPADAVDVTRASIWGNPFKVGLRDEVIAQFTEWVWKIEQRPLRNRARLHLTGKDLICWCAPLDCHARVWMEVCATPMEEIPNAKRR